MSATENSETMSNTPFDIPVRKDIIWDFSEISANFCGRKTR